jgi:LAS superfamily LD-carboxypeptidase LdcB
MGEGRIPGPLGGTRGAGQRLATPAPVGCEGHDESVSAGPSLSFDEFKARVLERQIRNAIKKGRQYCTNVPDSELARIEGKYRMRSEAAANCRELLKAARDALAAAKKSGNALAKQTSSIGIYSAYRNISEDTAAWEKCFLQYYCETYAERVALPGGIHGPKALALMLLMMIKFKAAPGYSNHSNGMAVDFSTMYRGKPLTAKKAQRAKWRQTWFHQWLKENAETYRFNALSTEEWHWDFG